MNAHDNPDTTAPLPDPQEENFEAFVRSALAYLMTTVNQLGRDLNQLSRDQHQLGVDQRDRYVDLRLRLSAMDEKIDAYLRESVILKRDLQKLQDKVDPHYSA